MLIKSQERPSSRCRRIVPLERGAIHVTICNSFLGTEAKVNVSADAHDFNNIETRSVIEFFNFLQGNSRHSDRNIRGKCAILCQLQKLGGPV